eukprot:2127514-Karenia_brevis.AAC.1
MASAEAPCLEAVCGGRTQTSCSDDDVVMDLPEYDLRRAYTAQDPHANDKGGGCSNILGSNMRAGGGVLGACVAPGGGTELQGYGTPHLHVEVHIACAYQYGILQDVMQKFKDGKCTFEQWVQYQASLHFEDLCDPQAKADMGANLEKDWHDRFAAEEHNDLPCTPEYLVRDASTTEGGSDVEILAEYLADIQT